MGRWNPGIGAGDYGPPGSRNVGNQVVEDLAQAGGSAYDAYQQRRAEQVAQRRQGWLDELTLRKYLDENDRFDKQEKRQVVADQVAAKTRARDDASLGFFPEGMVSPEQRLETVQSIGMGGKVETRPRYRSIAGGEMYDESKNPDVRGYNERLFTENEDRGKVRAIADGVRKMGPKYVGLAESISQLTDVKQAQEVANAALTEGPKTRVAAAGAQSQSMFSPAWAGQAAALADKQLDDFAAQADGDPEVAAQLATAAGMNASQVNQARGRARAWRVKNGMNRSIADQLDPPKKTVTPTGSTR